MAGPRREPTTIHEIAVFLTERGYSLVPLHPESKRPIEPTWTSLRLTVAEIKQQLHPDTDCNFGIILGRRIGDSNRWLVCLDVDREDETLILRVRCALGVAEGEAPFVAKRGKKGLAIFGVVIGDEPPRSYKCTLVEQVDGKPRRRNVVEFLAAGNQTVLPPSIHPDTGEPYHWLGKSLLDIDPADLPVFSSRAWEEIKWAVRDPEKPVFALNDMTPSDPRNDVAGTIHDTTLSAIRSLIGLGWSDEDVLARVERAVERADPMGHRPTLRREIEERIASAHKKNAEEGFTPGQSDKKIKPHWRVATWIVNDWRGHGLVRLRRGALAAYEDGWYRMLDLLAIQRAVAHEHQASRGQFIARDWTSIAQTALVLAPPFPEYREWNDTPHRVCLQNGTFDMDTGELLPWSPEHYLLSQLPFAYDPEAQSPIYDSVLQRAFWQEDRDEEHVETSINLFEEFVAHTLFECFDFHKMLAIVGEPRSGKSTLAKLIQMLHSEAAVSAVPFSDFKDPRMAIAMVHSLVNISSETQIEGMAADDFIKALTSGDVREWRSLYSSQTFHAAATARLIVIGNELFRTYDTSGAMEERMLILRCDNSIPEEQQNPRLLHELKDELPGIFNRIVAAWQRLFERGRFQQPQLSRDEIALFSEENNHMSLWLKECTHEGARWENPDYEPDKVAQAQIDKHPLTPNDILYNQYRFWAESRGHRPFPLNIWGKKLMALRVPGVNWSYTRIHVGGSKGTVVRAKPLHLINASTPNPYDFDRQQPMRKKEKS